MTRKRTSLKTKLLYAVIAIVLLVLPILLSAFAVAIEGAAQGAKSVCFWWPILISLYLVFLFYIGLFKMKVQMTAKIFWAAIVGLALYAIHWILHDFYLESKICDWFFLFEIILFLVYASLVVSKKKDNKATKQIDSKNSKVKHSGRRAYKLS